MKTQQHPPTLRRRSLLVGGLAGATGAAFAPSTQAAAAPTPKPVATKAHIVIAGSGLGGVALAHRLETLLQGARITIIDAKEVHNYQPGYTLVASGVWPVSKVIESNADLLPKSVKWIREMVAEFEPASNIVITTGGQRIEYDYLIVATGTHQDWSLIEGMDLSAIGQKGLASVYPNSEAARLSWAAMDAFRQKGGRAVMTLPTTPLKCAGAPLKMTFMLRDRLAQAGTWEKSSIQFYSGLDNIFSVKVINDKVLERWQSLDIGVNFLQPLTGIDISAQKAFFNDTEVEYDFLHAVPPMRAPDAVKNSDLAWQEGAMAAGGWLEVDKETLQHRRYKNVFGLGDINGTPRGKTAATVKKSAPMVAAHLVDVISGREPGQRFDGYTSCPMLLREGSAWLIEFDYDGNLIPSLPMIEPLQDSYFAWLMKTRMLKPAYMAVLKGRV